MRFENDYGGLLVWLEITYILDFDFKCLLNCEPNSKGNFFLHKKFFSCVGFYKWRQIRKAGKLILVGCFLLECLVFGIFLSELKHRTMVDLSGKFVVDVFSMKFYNHQPKVEEVNQKMNGIESCWWYLLWQRHFLCLSYMLDGSYLVRFIILQLSCHYGWWAWTSFNLVGFLLTHRDIWNPIKFCLTLAIKLVVEKSRKGLLGSNHKIGWHLCSVETKQGLC